MYTYMTVIGFVPFHQELQKNPFLAFLRRPAIHGKRRVSYHYHYLLVAPLFRNDDYVRYRIYYTL
jgi:hypothetical protein